jgi:uncharacterized protein (TIRG00374 family)
MKRIFIVSLKIAISILILWFLTRTSKLDFGLLINLVYSPYLLLAAIAMYLSGVLISAWRWYLLNKAQKIPLSLSHTLLPTYLGIAFNNILPGSVGGDFFRCYFLFKKIPDKRSAGMLAILFDRLTGLMGIFIAVCVAVILNFNLFESQASTFYFSAFCILLCLAAVIIYFASSLLPQQIGISAWLHRRFGEKKWITSVLSLLEAIRIYRNSKFTIVKCLFASFTVQVFIALICLLIARMMHFPEISFFNYILAIAVTQIVNLIPVTPGGFGIGEAAFANVLTLLNPGISASYATIFLAYRILGILVYIPGIAVFIFDTQLLKPLKEKIAT